MIDLVERQLEELTAVGAMFSADGESVELDEIALAVAKSVIAQELPPTELVCLSVNISLHTLDTCDRATLHATLPAGYPAEPAEIQVSCPALTSEHHAELTSSLRALSLDASAADREALAELAMALQHEANDRLQRQQQRASVARDAVSAATTMGYPPSLFGRRMLWFHHIKSPEKRKEIVARARGAQLRGFSKPGFPGVIVVEGRDDECKSFVEGLRALRWQAMDVRWEQTLDRVPSLAEGGCLPDPFVELRESDMGEAMALCARAGIEGEFRRAILKLEGRDTESHGHDGQSSLPDAGGRRTDGADENECVVVVVHIDHMNDPGGYLKLLKKWTAQLGLWTRIIFVGGGPNSGGGGGTKQTAAAARVSNILCVLRGEPEATRAFLQRLRTQPVDVDRSGRPCKERQSTVRWQGPYEPSSATLADTELAIGGWDVVDDVANQVDALRVAIATCGVSRAHVEELVSGMIPGF